MPTYFQKPENALRRAEEFISVGKKQPALDVLYDVIKSKRHRVWQKIHVAIMTKYLDLCVDLKKSHTAKEGLYQYKNICLQVNVNSLIEIVELYLHKAEEKTEEARKESQQAVVDDDDLDMVTPESLLLSTVTGENMQDRADKALLTPYVKFLWESYRQCLELLRNNNKVEKLYHKIAQSAFNFCVKYQRKTEFRKLCDSLRTHIVQLNKQPHLPNLISLLNPESQGFHLETRLAQLEKAVEMELWQEAFKAVEDIHDLLGKSKKAPRASLMANYYKKLSQVFQKSNSPLFHAAAWHRLYFHYKDNKKNISQDELYKLASRVVVATLAVPLPPARAPVDQLILLEVPPVKEKHRHLATLLGLPREPTREQLIRDLVAQGIVRHVYPELQSLYKTLETEFHPLQLGNAASKAFEFVANDEELSDYLTGLQDIAALRTLKQVAEIYQAIEIKRFEELVPYLSKFRIQRIIVDAAKTLDLQVRIDHRKGSLSFDSEMMAWERLEVVEGPHLQSSSSDQLRAQLVNFAEALARAVEGLKPKALVEERQAARDRLVTVYRQTARNEQQRLLQRHSIIEERKEMIEQTSQMKAEEEKREIQRQEEKARAEEKRRLEKEQREREEQSQQEKMRKIKKDQNIQRIDAMIKTDVGAKVIGKLINSGKIDREQLGELDAEELLQKQVEQLEKERRETLERLKQQEKKLDYYVRAQRKEELTVRKEWCNEQRHKHRQFFEQQEQKRVEEEQKSHEHALAQRNRLLRMQKDADAFFKKLAGERKDEYEEKLEKFHTNLEKERRDRLAERKQKRKTERREKWLREREEEKQRLRDEAMKREREEREAEERERAAREKAEYEERLRKLREVEDKKRGMEAEIERREREERQARQEKDVDRSKEVWRPGGRTAGGWRDREKNHEEEWRARDPDPPRDWRQDRDDRRGPRSDERRDGPWGRRDDERRDDRREGGWRRPDEGRDRRDGPWGRREDDRRDDRREGFGRRDDDKRDDRREGFGRRDDYRRDDRREGFGRRDDDRRDGQWGRRDDDRRDDRREGFGRRDDDRRGDRRDEPWGRRNDDRRDDRRDGFGRRDDRREGFGRRDDERRRDDADDWRKGGSRRDDRRDDRGVRGDRGAWGRDEPRRDDRRDDGWRKREEPARDGWRDQSSREPSRPEPRREERRQPPRSATQGTEEDDEWTVVRR